MRSQFLTEYADKSSEIKQEEFAQLSAQAFQNFHDTLVEQCIGKNQDTCSVTKYLVNAIKARAPTTIETLLL